MQILLTVQISFVDPVVGQPMKDELRGEFASFEVEACKLQMALSERVN
jgi:hypothetical protein